MMEVMLTVKTDSDGDDRKIVKGLIYGVLGRAGLCWYNDGGDGFAGVVMKTVV